MGADRPPLRPSPEDIEFVARRLEGRGPFDMLVLGVTPELVAIPLAVGSTVTAVDREQVMIDSLFRPGPGRRALVGDWRDLPLPDASIDVAVGDGCTTLFAFPDEDRAFFTDLARVVRPGGLVILRLFAANEVRETLDNIRTALPSIGSPDVLRWRIAMALMDPARGTRVAAIREAFDALVPDRAALAASTGWRRETIDRIDTYKDSPATWSYPTANDIRGLLAPAFTEIACHIPSYDMGDRCPTLVLRRA